jgi:hypothetical protein
MSWYYEDKFWKDHAYINRDFLKNPFVNKTVDQAHFWNCENTQYRRGFVNCNIKYDDAKIENFTGSFEEMDKELNIRLARNRRIRELTTHLDGKKIYCNIMNTEFIIENDKIYYKDENSKTKIFSQIFKMNEKKKQRIIEELESNI